MKFFSTLILLTLVAACDPYGFGFKKNPAYVLDEAFKAVMNQDEETFLEMTGKEAYCVYGNETGLNFLKDKIIISTDNIKLNLKEISNVHYTAPKFVGYWSYYNSRYRVEVLDKGTNEVLLETLIDCDYGIEGQKNPKYINQKPSKYKKKECRAVKLLPKKFAPLEVSSKCTSFKIDL